MLKPKINPYFGLVGSGSGWRVELVLVMMRNAYRRESTQKSKPIKIMYDGYDDYHKCSVFHPPKRVNMMMVMVW